MPRPHIFILLLGVLTVLSYSADRATDPALKVLPRIELTINTGFFWMAQIKSTLNFNEYTYLKLGASTVLLASEADMILGLQRNRDNKNRVQLGIGYARQVGEMLFGDSSRWNGVIAECVYIHYFYQSKFNLGFNFGINCIAPNRTNAIPSINTGLVLGFL